MRTLLGIRVWGRRIVMCPAPVRSAFRRGQGDASCSGITQRARPRQPRGETNRSTDTVQIADEDEIDFGALRTRTTPTVSPVESAARATRSSPHERDMRRNREPVHHVVIRCRANDGSSHKRPRFILYRACRIPRTSTRRERSGNRSSHAWLPVRFYSSLDVGDDVCGLRRPPPLKVNASIGIRSRLANGRMSECATLVIVPTSRSVSSLCGKNGDTSGAARMPHSFSIG